jgi:nucleoid-associated protein YgaU
MITRPQVASGEDVPHHVVERGESLWTIAEMLVSNGNRWTELTELNPLLKDPFAAIPSGTKIWVPFHWLEEWLQQHPPARGST